MFGKVRKLKGVDKKYSRDAELLADYESTEPIGRVRLGKLKLYYRDLGVSYFVPYEYIERAFNRVSIVEPDDSPAYFYYRLILVHGDKEFANLIFDKEEDVDRIIVLLKERNPDMAVGYVPPADGKRKYFA